MSLSFDVEDLFAQIEVRPILWNPSDALFSNRDKSKEAWTDIGRVVIPDFETLKFSKQCEYVEQMKRKYYEVRGAYRKALNKNKFFALGSKLSFLHQVWKIPPSGENSSEAGEWNVGEDQKCKTEAPASENNHNSLIDHLKPVLSIRKIDDTLVKKKSSKRGRPPTRKSCVQLKVESPKATNSIVQQEQPIVNSDDESKEESGNAKKCRYRCDIQMASTQESTLPKHTSTYASLSFGDDEQSAERRIVPSHNYDSYTDRYNYMYTDRAVRDRGYSPTPSSLRSQECYFDPRRYTVIQPAPLDYNDDDMAFFRSLLTWTRRFNEDEKLEFRSEVMRLVSRIRNCESAENYYVLSQTPLS